MGWIIFLLLLGLALLLLELFVTPGVLIGIFGVLAWVIAIHQVYNDYGVTEGNLTLISVIVLTIAGVVFGLKANVWSKFTINSSLTTRVNEVKEFTPEKGMKGKALSALRPMGSASFGNNVVVEVHTQGDMIPNGAEIEIIGLESRKIIVKQI